MRRRDLAKLAAIPLALCLGAVAPAAGQSWPTHDFELLAVDEKTIRTPLPGHLNELYETLAVLGLDATTVGSSSCPTPPVP